jgi:hypothetical protein
MLPRGRIRAIWIWIWVKWIFELVTLFENIFEKEKNISCYLKSNILEDGNHIFTLNWKNHLFPIFPSSLSEFVGLKNHYQRVIYNPWVPCHFSFIMWWIEATCNCIQFSKHDWQNTLWIGLVYLCENEYVCAWVWVRGSHCKVQYNMFKWFQMKSI